MLILGLNAYHGDAAACVIRDGILIAAAEEERFRRIKHWAGFPAEAIGYCLAEAGAGLADITHVAVNSDPKAHFAQKITYTPRRRPDLPGPAGMDRLRDMLRGVQFYPAESFYPHNLYGRDGAQLT